jgi:hypothetical protein
LSTSTSSSAALPIVHVVLRILVCWLAVLLTFLLACVFAHGALMRDDLAGTV